MILLFSSLAFLFIFLPLVLLFYIPGKQRWKNGTLLLFSLLFYAWGGVSLSVILILSICIFDSWDYLLHPEMIEKYKPDIVVFLTLETKSGNILHPQGK